MLPLNDPKRIWENLFQQKWSRLAHHNVKGWDFVLSHFTKGEPTNPHGANVPGLPEFLASLDLPAIRPFFYSQHRVLRATVGAPYIYGQDDGTTSTDLFSRSYPNAFAFCGHAHLTNTDERAIWQDGFTCIAVPSLRYNMTGIGRENGVGMDDPPDRGAPVYSHQWLKDGAAQGLFVSLTVSGATIRRWDFSHDGVLGPDWHVPFPTTRTKPYQPAVRSEAEPIPQFAADAQIAIHCRIAPDRTGTKREMFVVEFPQALHAATAPRADDYSVRLEMKCGTVERILNERRFFSEDYAMREDPARPLRCNFPKDEVPLNRLLRFTVIPNTAFGHSGKPLSSPWRKFEWKTEEETI